MQINLEQKAFCDFFFFSPPYMKLYFSHTCFEDVESLNIVQ